MISDVVIPAYCFALDNRTINPLTKKGEVIKVVALETGFRRKPSGLLYEERFLTQDEVDELNLSRLEITRAMSRAMYDSSMFGWHLYQDSLQRYIKSYEPNKEIK